MCFDISYVSYRKILLTHVRNSSVKRLRERELMSELRFHLVQRVRKSTHLGAFMKL